MDVRCRSPYGVRADALEILHRLSITDPDDALWDAYNWPDKMDVDHTMTHNYDFEEEEAEACDPCLYDPSLFSPVSSHPASPLQSTFSHYSGRDKPLPPPPELLPSTPRLSYSPMSTPPSSPRASMIPYGTNPHPRSRPPSTVLGTPRSGLTHTTFPSISSTLSSLEERESEVEKRSGVIVTEQQEPGPLARRTSGDSTVLAHPPSRKSSVEALQRLHSYDGSPKRKARPTLNLMTSTSSPQLRTLAELATIPASPIRATSKQPAVHHQPSLASLVTAASSPTDLSEALLPPAPIETSASTSASRWSMDSIDENGAGRPVVVANPGGESPQSPAKARKRDRLKSFISRARAGSLGKQSSTPLPDGDPGLLSPRDSQFTSTPSASVLSLGINSRRTSRAVYPPEPIAISTSTSTTTTTSTASTASLATPADSQHDVSSVDPFCPASPTFAPASYLPDADVPRETEPIDPFTSPTLPPPSPDTPSPSLFLPAKQDSSFPFLTALTRKSIRRRKKKLIITCIPEYMDEPEEEGPAQIAAQRRQRNQKKREDCIAKWCQSFGVVRRFEHKPDGSMHVYWRDWEVADMVCRVSAQVNIKGAGRVSLAWRYVN